MLRPRRRTPLLVYAGVGLSLGLLAAVIFSSPRVTGHDPAAGASESPAQPLISISFSQSMRPETVESRFRLDPSRPGTFRWEGRTMTFTPLQPWPEATQLANVAAGVVVGKLGTATVGVAELAEALHGPRARHRGGVRLEELLLLVAQARAAGEKIVLTNGCFDILHAGHVHYLQQARELGDRLIVLVNSDASVRRLKGESRPVNSLEQRMTLLAALECVDWVTPFDADTPREAICCILPDILVKGGDYAHIGDIAGSDCVLANGGEVRLLDFVEGHSTSRLIEAIRQG